MAWKFHLTDTDLTRIRFAFSPLWECVSSLRVLRDPVLGALHEPWIKEVRASSQDLDLEPLFKLVLDPGKNANYIPDFLTPPPSAPFPEFRAELEAMRRTPHEIVRHNIRRNYRDRPEIPDLAKPFLETPEVALENLAEQLEAYWTVALEAHWPRLRRLLEGDVMLRARQLALGGAELLFRDLHPSLTYENRVLEKRLPASEEGTRHSNIYPDGLGLVIVPSVFVGSRVMTMKKPWPHMLIYPARGSANFWGAPAESNAALRVLLGSGCARVFEALHVPTGTLELASRLRIAPGNVSYHLQRLARIGLVESHRQGRFVFYRHSRQAEELMGVFAENVG